MQTVESLLGRWVRLPADLRSALHVRRLLRSTLHEAGLDDLIDDAVLLTSELCENAILHAGTELRVSADLSDTDLTVTVLDRGPTPLEIHRARPPARADRAATHGRGLLLVDSVASSWGTRHDAAGHQVWFTLRRTHESRLPADQVEPAPALDPAQDPAPLDPSTPSTLDGPVWPDREQSRWLLYMDERQLATVALAPLVSELARRLCDVLGADGVAVWVDYADGAGEQELASSGRRPDSDCITLPLPLSAPLTGRLEVQLGHSYPRAAEVAELTAQRVALAVESDWLRASDRRRWSWMTYLAEASELLAHSLDVELTAALVPQIIVPRIGAWCAVHLLDQRDQLELAALSHVDEAALPTLRAGLGASRAQLRTLLHSGSDAVGVTLPAGASADGIAVPIVSRGQPLGTLAVGRPSGRSHSPEEIMVISDVARRAAPAIDNAQRNTEHVATSQALQQALLPRALPTADAVEFAAVYLPATSVTDVGGDFYDVIEIDDGCWLVATGDVCGKGAAAAARTGLVRNVLRVLVREGRPPAQALALLNEVMLEAGDPQQFATVVLAVVSRRPVEHPGLAVELVLAGHEPPVLVRADGTAELVGQHGTAAGLVAEFSVHPTRHVLNPGDALVSYTDGVTERRSGDEEFGQTRLLAALADVGGLSAPAIVSGLRLAVEDFSTDPRRDDIAVVAVRAPT